MASVDVLNMLSVSAARLEYSGGGLCDLSAQDVAAMLAGVSRGAVLLAYAKYAQDAGALARLRAHVLYVVKRRAKQDGWRCRESSPVLLRVSALAVSEACSAMVCAKCCGRGFVGSRVCCRCHGSGHGRLSQRRMAEIVGIDESAWRRRWRLRYKWVYDYIGTLESEVAMAVSAQIKRGDVAVCESL